MMDRSRKEKVGLALAVGLTAMCFILLVALGVTVVHPYQKTRSFTKTECRGLQATTHDFLECSCNGHSVGCWSVFPCREVMVEYQVLGSGTLKSVVYKDYDTLHDDRPCSYVPCNQSPQSNMVAVTSFLQTYVGTTFDCYINPETVSEVILKRPDELPVIMAVVWPGLGFIVGVILICYLTCRRRSFTITER